MVFGGVVVFDAVFWFFGGGELDTAFGNELHFPEELGLSGDYFTKRALVAIVAVDIGVVEGGDAFVEGGVDELLDGGGWY